MIIRFVKCFDIFLIYLIRKISKKLGNYLLGNYETLVIVMVTKFELICEIDCPFISMG